MKFYDTTGKKHNTIYSACLNNIKLYFTSSKKVDTCENGFIEVGNEVIGLDGVRYCDEQMSSRYVEADGAILNKKSNEDLYSSVAGDPTFDVPVDEDEFVRRIIDGVNEDLGVLFQQSTDVSDDLVTRFEDNPGMADTLNNLLHRSSITLDRAFNENALVMNEGGSHLIEKILLKVFGIVKYD